MNARTLAIACSVAVGCTLTGAAAAQPGVERGRIYRLLPASDFVEGCFDPCECPLAFQEDMRGRFRLTRVNVDPLYTNYRVSDVRVFVAGFNRTYTGAGTYRIGGEFALVDQMMLDLSVNGGEPVHFQSELTPKVGRWPLIDVSISRNNLFCHDTLLHVVAAPIADWNADGTRSVQDLFAFLGDYFGGAGDVDGNESTSVEDIFTFLGEYFAVE